MAYFSLLAARINLFIMKKIFTLACAALFLLTTAFQSVSSFDEVVNALRNGNATALSKYVDSNVELSLPSKTDNYSRQQAAVILQDFFSNNGVKDFEVKHKGDNGGSQFGIGTLVTRAGSYRTTIVMAEKNGKLLVKGIRFQQM